MKIFLTGASGFLGSYISQALLQDGYELVVLVRKKSRRDHLQHPKIQLVEGSLPECDFDASILEKCAALVHCAGLVKALSRETFFEVNAKGTEKLAQLLLNLKNPPKHFLHISTLAVMNPEIDGRNFCIPAAKCHPLSFYGQSKLAAEETLQILKRKMQLSILRPPVLYGPGDLELLPAFKLAAKWLAPFYGDGKNRFSLCHAKDVADAVLTLLGRPKKSDIYCLDDGHSLNWREFFEAIGRVMNKKILNFPVPTLFFYSAAFASDFVSKLRKKPQIFGREKLKEMKIKSWVCGYEKLNRELGWEPKIKLEDGLKECLAFYNYRSLLTSHF
ncbi:MAG: NAD(P)-dependent oxidoreductase [Deltaproteobacteria bacterium]|nr:NAD(P)-dependent oxidoreductase [Deltaproteobacteria bacterium]